MTALWKRHASGPLLRLLVWPLLIAFALLSLAMALQWLLALQLDSGFLNRIAWPWLLAAVGMQLLAALLMVLAWKFNLRMHGLDSVDLHQCTIMIGLNSIGKYTPGKVLGMLAKGGALYKMSGDGRLALQATVVEQLALLHSGATVAVVAWLFNTGNERLGLLVLPLVLLSVLILSRSGNLVIRVIACIARKKTLPEQAGHGFRKSYAKVFLALMLVWILAALTLYFCLATYGRADGAGFWWLLWIIALAYLAGFVVFFTPAGLGAREGVMLLMLGTQMEASLALYISILHRLITLLVDILLGAYALLFGKALLVPK